MSLFDEEPIRTIRIFCDCKYKNEKGQLLNGVFDFDIVNDEGYWSMTQLCSNPNCGKSMQIHHFPVKEEKVSE